MRCRLMGFAMRGACGDCGSAGAAYSSPMAASSSAVAAAVIELLMLRSSLPDAITSRHRRPLQSEAYHGLRSYETTHILSAGRA